MILQIIECLIAGIRVGFYSILKVLPFYEQLSGMKEQLFAWALGIPAGILIFFFAIPKIFKVFKEI